MVLCGYLTSFRSGSPLTLNTLDNCLYAHFPLCLSHLSQPKLEPSAAFHPTRHVRKSNTSMAQL